MESEQCCADETIKECLANGILLRAGFARDDLRVEVYWMPKKEPHS